MTAANQELIQELLIEGKDLKSEVVQLELKQNSIPTIRQSNRQIHYKLSRRMAITAIRAAIFTLLAGWSLLFFAQPVAAQTAVSLTAPTVPDNLKAPANEVPFLKVSAKGFQIYICSASSNDTTKYEWTLKAPEADLINEQGFKMGIHYGGPTWEALDQSKVIGEVKERINAPDGKGIPWLLLKAKETSGNGLLSKVSSIQRVETVAGFAPNAADCDQTKKDQEARVAYSASYYFYSLAETTNQTPPGVPASGEGGTQQQDYFVTLPILIFLGMIITASLSALIVLELSGNKNKL